MEVAIRGAWITERRVNVKDRGMGKEVSRGLLESKPVCIVFKTTI